MVPTYNLSFRDLVEMMEERRLSMAHTTNMRWVHQYEYDVILRSPMSPRESMKPM